MDEVPEERLQAAEAGFSPHDHEGIDIAEDSLLPHLRKDHTVDVPDGLSFGALAGLHDRFHGHSHAIDE